MWIPSDYRCCSAIPDASVVGYTESTVNPLSAGEKLGPYELLSPLGAGGMGEVWKARDTRLDRIVAIKVSQERFSERFEREARAIAALNHRHICILFDVGPDYLVMEYIEGKRVAGPLDIPEALRLASQIADALDAAHTRGIVHRDLKPGNILVTRSGDVKLLDFGLAKMIGSAVAATSEGGLTKSLTQEGVIVGTLQYMSPEQLQGKNIDSRSDIFSFGAVLYELLTNRAAFHAPNPASMVAAILTSQPGLVSDLVPLASPALDRLLRKCLAKDPEDRWQSARDLREALNWIAEDPPGRSSRLAPREAVATNRRGALPFWIAGALLAVTAAGLGGYLLHEGRGQPATTRLTIPIEFSVASRPALSPDASQIAFVTGDTNGTQLWVRRLSSYQTKRIQGGENVTEVFWSPEGKEIAFVAGTELRRVDVASDERRVVCRLPQSASVGAGSWGSSGVILVSTEEAIYRVPASGGEPVAVTHVNRSLGELKHLTPRFLPDGRRFLFLAVNQREQDSMVYETSLDSPQLQRILANRVGPVYLIGGDLLFVRESALILQPFDWKTGRLRGAETALDERVYAFAGSYSPLADFSATADTLVYQPEGPPQTEMVWFDRQGNRLSAIGKVAGYTNPALSPDQSRVAVAIADPKTNFRDLWLIDSRGGMLQLTDDPKDDFNAAWSPDGARIAFSSDRKGVRDVYVQSASGAGPAELLLSDAVAKSVEGWSPDGKLVIYNNGGGIMAVPVEGERNPFVVVPASTLADQGAISPDGKWIAYRTHAAGRIEVYVQTFSSGGARWQISTDGGGEPSWRHDGKELYFTRDRQLYAVDIKATPSGIEHGPPRLLFTAPFAAEIRRNRYAPAADGNRFLINTQGERLDRQARIVLNWRASLNRR